MNIVITRKYYTSKSTVGEMVVDGKFECYTLEDVVRVFKIFGSTAIPMGCYNVALTYSPRFGKTMPLIEDVRGFTGVRIHCGNKAEDTEGCILVGANYNPQKPDWISSSKDAYVDLYEKLIAAASNEEHITLEIIDTERGMLI